MPAAAAIRATRQGALHSGPGRTPRSVRLQRRPSVLPTCCLRGKAVRGDSAAAGWTTIWAAVLRCSNEGRGAGFVAAAAATAAAVRGRRRRLCRRRLCLQQRVCSGSCGLAAAATRQCNKRRRRRPPSSAAVTVTPPCACAGSCLEAASQSDSDPVAGPATTSRLKRTLAVP